MRLIPAHAGKTRTSAPARPSPSAHPRSRGENPPRRTRIPTSSGSSPLTRGKLFQVIEATPERGLIPAHAGKTQPYRPHSTTEAAHPRSRGENMVRLGQYADSLGSSPLTRGKPERSAPGCTSRRLIPAHAGKTRGRSPRAHRREAHPRSRGENSTSSTSSLTLHGSSPLTRGKHRKKRVDALATRLIPAHAGKTN